MKKFSFALDKLRSWRQIQCDTEQARLQALLLEDRQIQQRRARLAQDLDRSLAAVVEGRFNQAEELFALNQFSMFVQGESQRLAHLQSQLAQTIEKQRRVLIEARRHVEVLDQVRESRLKQWRVDVEREQENLVAELVVARWKTAAGSCS
jgi:flagellar export protein FliJ